MIIGVPKEIKNNVVFEVLYNFTNNLNAVALLIDPLELQSLDSKGKIDIPT